MPLEKGCTPHMIKMESPWKRDQFFTKTEGSHCTLEKVTKAFYGQS